MLPTRPFGLTVAPKPVKRVRKYIIALAYFIYFYVFIYLFIYFYNVFSFYFIRKPTPSGCASNPALVKLCCAILSCRCRSTTVNNDRTKQWLFLCRFVHPRSEVFRFRNRKCKKVHAHTYIHMHCWRIKQYHSCNLRTVHMYHS